MFGGWLSARVGPLKAYLLQGWTMIAAMVIFAFAPRITVVFVTIELLYRALATGCSAALLGIVMTAIGKGAASTKAAALWSLANLAFFYPTVIEGAVHDSRGTVAMLLTDAGIGIIGFVVILAAFRQLKDDGSRHIATLATSISWD